jgi:hypothetical protein
MNARRFPPQWSVEEPSRLRDRHIRFCATNAAANGMTIVIGRSGKFCAIADAPNAIVAAAIAASNLIISFAPIQCHLKLARIPFNDTHPPTHVGQMDWIPLSPQRRILDPKAEIACIVPTRLPLFPRRCTWNKWLPIQGSWLRSVEHVTENCHQLTPPVERQRPPSEWIREI